MALVAILETLGGNWYEVQPNADLAFQKAVKRKTRKNRTNL